jgi:hypothetical protein
LDVRVKAVDFECPRLGFGCERQRGRSEWIGRDQVRPECHAQETIRTMEEAREMVRGRVDSPSPVEREREKEKES